MMQEDQKGRKKDNIRAEEEQTTAVTYETTRRKGRRYRHTGTRPAGREKTREQREKHGKKKTKRARQQV